MKLIYILYGIIIGVANIIPGVSGGTMAVILNIYDDIILSISNIKSQFLKSLKLLFPIVLGAGIGILLFSKIIEFALFNFGVATNLVFVGLIIGSIPMIISKIGLSKLSLSHILPFILSLGIMISMRLFNISENEVVTSLSLIEAFKLLLVSMLASASMIIPGISGSFVMLLFGTYTTFLYAISNLNIYILAIVAVGFILGILLAAKLIEKLFSKASSQTYSAILGLMIGSIFVIFPSISLNMETLIGAFLLIIACFSTYFFSTN